MIHLLRIAALTLLCLLTMLSCNDERSESDQETPNRLSQDEVHSRKPFIAFDSVTYFTERRELLNAVHNSFLPQANRILRVWELDGAPNKFWMEVHARAAVKGILITWESGGSEGRNYTGMAIIETGSEYAIAYHSAQADSIVISVISENVVQSLVGLTGSLFRDSSIVTCNPPDPYEVDDDGFMIICSYINDAEGRFVALNSCDLSGSRAWPLMEALWDLTGWRYAR